MIESGPGPGGLWTGAARPLRDERGASHADQPQVKIGLDGRVTRAIWCLQLLARHRLLGVGFTSRAVVGSRSQSAFDVCLAPNSDARADIPGPPRRAISRCSAVLSFKSGLSSESGHNVAHRASSNPHSCWRSFGEIGRPDLRRHWLLPSLRGKAHSPMGGLPTSDVLAQHQCMCRRRHWSAPRPAPQPSQ